MIIERNIILLRTVLTCLFLSCFVHLMGQDAQVVKPLKESNTKSHIVECYASISGNSVKQSSLWTAGVNVLGKDYYSTQIFAGVGGNYIFGSGMVLNLDLGYNYERIAFDRSIIPASGVLSHRMNINVSLMYLCLGAGVKTGFFLGSNTKSTSFETFNGLFDECFNKASVAWFICAEYRFSILVLKGKVGSYIVPNLNVDKIAYYNMHKTRVDCTFFEVGLAFRIFSTKNRMY